MTDDAMTGGSDQLDTWLDSLGFIDLELDAWVGAVDDADLDDPWANTRVDPPTLTDAQRRFLLGDVDVAPDAADLEAASAEIIDIPSDPDAVEPFDG